ncbi:hypothetical protein C8J57DRAFT_1512671 [Mycena rebaudengoi]|nr:hypothetical protein C8J57DRAFT_1515851 [Mycena rebaudengoi]KAJ7263856.1 hypothetical protein C8J57DRAFT_1512671 [Mycena rebaudengoi]
MTGRSCSRSVVAGSTRPCTTSGSWCSWTAGTAASPHHHDRVSTLTQPVSVVYLAYLIYLVAAIKRGIYHRYY